MPPRKKTTKRKVSKRRVVKKKAVRRRKPKRKSKAGAGSRYAWIKWLSGAALLVVLLIGGYSLYLSKSVRVKFDGKRWAIPAQVYARPLELYVGAEITANAFSEELQRLGYRKVKKITKAAQWTGYNNKYLVRTRSFDFQDAAQPGQLLSVQFDAAGISALKNISSGKAVDLLRLEPPLIGSIYPAHKEDRILVRLSDLPEHLVNALLAVEDRRFFEHSGINYTSIARALWANVKARRTVQGGSTLTQQLVKNFFLTSERSLWRKFNEALIAWILEARYSKNEILEAYANEIFLGQDGARAIHGFGLAARYYFDRPVQELSLAESALLVGLVKGASYYNPRRHPERAKKRRNLVLDQMLKQDFINEKQNRFARKKALNLSARKRHNSHRYPAFIDLVRRQLRRDYREEDLTSEGLSIFTTLDPAVQSVADKVVRQQLAQLEKQKGLKKSSLQAAVVIASSDDGEVLALTGGRDNRATGFNRALDAVRPVGSLIKPAVYLSALQDKDKYTLVTPLDDTSISVKLRNGKTWTPRNYDRKSHGDPALYQALVKSYNQATVRLGMDVGLNKVLGTLKKLGLNRPINVFPSMLLGASAMSPIEVTQLYQTLAAEGFRSPIRAIRAVRDSQGQELQRYPITVKKVVDANVAYLMKYALVDVMRSGTGRSAYRYLADDMVVAGKTGTTNDLRDSWFAGFSQDMVAVVWLGNDNNEPVQLTGSSGGLSVWAKIMAALNPLSLDMLPPEDIQHYWVDSVSGRQTGKDCDNAVLLPFIANSEPRQHTGCGRSVFESVNGWFE